MKTKFNLAWLALLAAFLLPFSAQSQDADAADSTGLPGDHFSLEGALELFKKAESPEAFEKALNSENNHVNNLDLNEDGQTDYIRVIDNMDGDAHAIVLQVPVSEVESQDIAVIEIEKTGDEEAMLQILGDEDIYGKQVIVEPFEEEAKSKGRGPQVEIVRIVVNVWLWPSVRFVYAPGYRLWVSPWRWHYYPAWWSPWRVHPRHVHHRHVVVYRPHYHVVTTHRVAHAHKVYVPKRTHSKVVHTKTTTVVKSRHGNTVGSKTTTKTTVKGKHGGKVTREKTTVKGPRGGSKTKTKTSGKRGH